MVGPKPPPRSAWIPELPVLGAAGSGNDKGQCSGHCTWSLTEPRLLESAWKCSRSNTELQISGEKPFLLL